MLVTAGADAVMVEDGATQATRDFRAVAALRAELAEAEADLESVKKRDEAEALKSAEKQQRIQALEEARKQGAALKQRIAELEAQLAN